LLANGNYSTQLIAPNRKHGSTTTGTVQFFSFFQLFCCKDFNFNLTFLILPICILSQQTTIFTPIDLDGELHLKNRIALAPLTRARSHEDGIPDEINAEYYVQRGMYFIVK
jgi:hypothetical protein